MMESLADDLINALQNASGRSIGTGVAVIGIAVWWLKSRVKKGTKILLGEQVGKTSERPEVERPRRRLPLRAYHR
jgi:hypothetical protein